jgi:hypothetical protein
VRWTEPRQCVRVFKFRSVLDRYDMNPAKSTRSKPLSCLASPSGHSAVRAIAMRKMGTPV